jgi:hypothetical protein
MPGESVIIETSSGELRRFEWSEVAEVVRGSTGSTRHAEGPTPERPYVHIDVAGTRSVTLYRVLGRSLARAGGYTATSVAYARVCDDPCDLQLDDANVELFVGGDVYAASKPFYLKPRASAHALQVQPRR